MKQLFILLFIFYSANSIFANNKIRESTLSFPIQTDLKELEKIMNKKIPHLLTNINEKNRVCVKAQWIETSFFKTKISPEIRCDIKGWVKRNGNISFSGNGSKFKIAFPIKSEITAKAGIKETAKASAIIYLTATPKINKNWSISLNIKPNLTWSNRPTLELFGFIKVNITDRVEPKVKKEINKYVKKLPEILKKLKLKEKVTSAWKEIQKPLKLKNYPKTYLLFKPKNIAYSGFQIEKNILKTTLNLKGESKIIIGDEKINLYKKTKLPNLNKFISKKSGDFFIPLPVNIFYEEIEQFFKKKYPDGLRKKLNKQINGILNFSNLKIRQENKKLLVSLDVNFQNNLNWFNLQGNIIFKGIPYVDKNKRIIFIRDLEYKSITNNQLFSKLIEISGIEIIKQYLGDEVQFYFGDKIDESIEQANKSLNKKLKNGMKISGNLEKMVIEKVLINKEYLQIKTNLQGKIGANLEF